MLNNSFRIGQGYDCHALIRDRPLIIGGVAIPYSHGLLGHSDADVLLHAITDALLGAGGLGDIGHYFPDTDPQFAHIDSRSLLRNTVQRLATIGYCVGNIDSTVIAQAPKLAPYLVTMRQHIADDCSVCVHQVNVKAKTNEQMGFVGRKEGIVAQAVVLVFPR